MDEWSTFVNCLIFAYLLGSIPFGKIVGLKHGLDLQRKGSGNIGFANSVRVLGWRAGLVVLFGDTLKGFIPARIALTQLDYELALIVGLVAVLAHIYPVWLKFHGGKGVATGLGISMALAPVVGLMGLCVYLLVFSIFRKSAIGSLAAAWSMPLWALAVKPEYALCGLILAILGTYTHSSNIYQLLRVKDVSEP